LQLPVSVAIFAVRVEDRFLFEAPFGSGSLVVVPKSPKASWLVRTVRRYRGGRKKKETSAAFEEMDHVCE